MSTIWWIILITAIAGIGGTGLGGLIGALFKKDSSKVVSLLLSFAGGVMLAVVCFDLLVSAENPEGAQESVPIWIIILGVLAGYGIVYLLNYLIDIKTNKEVKHIDAAHPKTADNLDELIHSDHLKVHEESTKKLLTNYLLQEL